MDACDLKSDQDRTEWISRVMQAIATLKPGMARRDLTPLLREEGGLSTRSRRTYVYQHCPYIKVEVEFAPLEGAGDENPDDNIVKISNLFWNIRFTIELPFERIHLPG